MSAGRRCLGIQTLSSGAFLAVGYGCEAHYAFDSGEHIILENSTSKPKSGTTW